MPDSTPVPSADRPRVVVVVGPGRSGTSALTAGVGALGVELGPRLKPASAKNPKGFFEDLDILDINHRLCRSFGLTTTGSDVRAVDPRLFASAAVQGLRDDAVRLMRRRFGGFPIWGFKSGGVLRLLPFWESVFQELGVSPSYVLALRHPGSVARSRARLNPLRGRQEKSDLEWLSRVVPYLGLLRQRTLAVVDFDRLMGSPVEQLTRLARHLGIDLDAAAEARVLAFARTFLEPGFHHHRRSASGVADERLNPLVVDAFRNLSLLAQDRVASDDAAFWERWSEIERSYQLLEPLLRHIDHLERELRRSHWGLDDWIRIGLRRLRSVKPRFPLPGSPRATRESCR